MGDLNARESQMFNFIKTFMKKNGVTPTLREIGEGVGLTSTMTIHKYFTQLVDKGYIQYKGGKSYVVKGMEYREVEDERKNES